MPTTASTATLPVCNVILKRDAGVRSPSPTVIFSPDEIAEIAQNGGFDTLLWKTKREFGPHLRSFPEQTEAPCTPPKLTP